MASDDSDILVRRVGALVLRDETAGANNIKGSDAEELLGIVDSFRLEDLGADWDGGVDWVGNDKDVGFRRGVGAGFGEVTNDGGVGIEQVY